MHNDRLGFYIVGQKKFTNKTLALIESHKTNNPVSWVFNNNVYGKIDWTIPIQESLQSLYKRRAQQLRDNYDYLVLYFSGGIDSTNILHAFIDNDIFLDEIVMQCPAPFEQQSNNKDTSNANFWSEVKYSAIPYLNKVKNLISPNTKIRYEELYAPLIEVLKNDNWFEHHPPGTNITIGGIARQKSVVSSPYILNLCEQKKKTAQILGVDKPLVGFNGENYYAYFLDLSVMHSPAVDLTSIEVFENLYRAELFYWTPDMPEIVVKQAQEIKNYCEANAAAKTAFANSHKLHIQHFRTLLNSIIYPPYIELDFVTDKPSSNLIRPMDAWFWNVADEKIKDNYWDGVNFLKHNISSEQLIDGDILNGLSGHISRYYKL